MRSSYAVTWCNGGERTASGRLELGADSITLEGLADGAVVHEEIPYRDLSSVSIGRGARDRIGGRHSLVLCRAGRGPVRIAGVAEAWIVSELAERLASIHVDRRPSRSRLAVVVPIKTSARERVRSMLEGGAPFDPEEAGLDRHTALLADHEVVFLFEAEAPEAIERLFGRPELWQAAEAWKEHVAGPASVAEVVYEWERS